MSFSNNAIVLNFLYIVLTFLLIPLPVGDARQLRPAFADLALTVKVMAVRGLLYSEVVPVGRLVVRPRYHAVQQVALLCGIRQSTRLIMVMASARVMRASGRNVPSG